MISILTILFGLLGLGIIVLVHEFGHFIAAKLSGIEVEVFSLGWGKKLVGFTHKGTLYQISAFPLGGYCKMKGEYPKKDETSEEVMQKMRQEKGSYLAASPWSRCFVSAAGPLANIIFATIVIAFTYFIGFSIVTVPSRIILASDYKTLTGVKNPTPADKGGLKTGDKIVAIDNQPIQYFSEVVEKIHASPQKTLQFTVERTTATGTSTMVLPVTPEEDPETGFGRIGVTGNGWIDPVVSEVAPGKAAAVAGLQTGDVITAVNNQPVNQQYDFYSLLKEEPGKKEAVANEVTFIRAGQTHTVTFFTEYNKQGKIDGGIDFKQVVIRSPQYGFFKAASVGFGRIMEILRLTVRGLTHIFDVKDKRLDDVVAGPFRMIQWMGESATGNFTLGVGAGITSFFQFISFISVFVAFMNLLPIPALDGGVFVLSVFEGVRRKPLTLKSIYRFQIVGFMIIFSLIALALFSEILYYFF